MSFDMLLYRKELDIICKIDIFPWSKSAKKIGTDSRTMACIVAKKVNRIRTSLVFLSMSVNLNEKTFWCGALSRDVKRFC